MAGWGRGVEGLELELDPRSARRVHGFPIPTGGVCCGCSGRVWVGSVSSSYYLFNIIIKIRLKYLLGILKIDFWFLYRCVTILVVSVWGIQWYVDAVCMNPRAFYRLH